jgi:Tol biopolymer transport system component
LKAAWSRDGKRLAVLAAGQGGAHGSSFIKNQVSDDWYQQDVYVVGSDGSGLLDITNSVADESWPSWSPEGDRIAFVTLSPGARTSAPSITDPDGSNAVRLTGARVTADAPVWRPMQRMCSAYTTDMGSNAGTSLSSTRPGAPRRSSSPRRADERQL